MITSGRLHSQVAATAGVAADEAMAAVYLLDLSRAGKSLDEAAVLMRRERHEVRDRARDWGIGLRDYCASDPLILQWHKVSRGLWELRHEAALIAEVRSDGEGAYVGEVKIDTPLIREIGSTAQVAARRLSKLIDKRSIGIFGVDDILIRFPLPDGSLAHCAPDYIGDPKKLRPALAA